MKPKVIRALGVVSALLFLGVLIAFAQPKGETVKVKGEVVDLWCFLEGGDRGADHKQCAISCAKAGNPIGLVTEKDEVYVMMGLKGRCGLRIEQGQLRSSQSQRCCGGSGRRSGQGEHSAIPAQHNE